MENTKEKKVIHINVNLHDRLREYCNEHGLKINKWVEIQLIKILDELENKIPQ
jgi:hypothetical protein